MATDMTAKLTLEASTSGEDKLQGVADALRALGQGAGQVTPELDALAGELDKLAREQALIDQFKQLKEQTAGWADAAAKAQQAAKESALALKAQQAALASAQAGEQALAQTLARARDEHARMGEAIKGAQQELRELGAASKAAGADAQGYAQRTQEVRAQLAVLHTAYQDSGAQVKQLAGEQRAAAAATREVGAGAKVAEAAFERNRQAAARANQAYDASRVALQRQRDAMGEVGVSSTHLAAAQVQLNARLEQVRGKAQAAAAAYADLGRGAQAAAAMDMLGTLQKRMAQLFAAGRLIGFAKDAVATADAFGQMAERIRMATGSQEEFNLVQERLLASANTTYRALSEQQEMYIRSAEALKSLGYNTSQALDITDSFSYLLATNAASGERAAAAIAAYTKAIQSGRIDVEGWQSLLAATPTLVQAIASSTGKTTEEVRQLGITGQLAVRDLNEVLRLTVEQNKKATEGMVTTVHDAMTALGNTWGEFLRKTNEGSGATQKLVGLIDLLRRNLDTVTSVAMTAGQALLVVASTKAVQALVSYAGEIAKTSRAVDALEGSAKRAAFALSSIGPAVAAMGAGWTVGTWLREQFQWVEQAGIRTAAALHGSAVYAAGGWEVLKAAVTGGSIEEAVQRLRGKLGELDAGYKELYQSAQRTGQAQKEQADAAAKAADAAQQQAAAQSKLKAALDGLGVSAAAAMGQVSSGAKGALQDLDAVAASAGKAGLKAADAARAIELAFMAAIPKADSVQALDELQARLAALAQAGSINTAEFKRMSVALDEQRQKVEDATPGIQSMDEALRALGANGAQALGQVSTSAQAAINGLDAVAEAATQAGIGTEKAARAIELAFLAAIPKVDSLEAIKVLEERLKAMGAAGQIGAAGIARVQQELAKQKAAIEGQLPGIQSLEEALRNLGVKPRAELQRLAAAAKESFDYVRQSGTASTREVAEAWRAMAEAAIAANDGVATQAIKSGAAQYGFAVETDKAGKSIVKSMQEAEAATTKVGDAAQKSGADMAGMAGQAAKSAQDLAAQARAHQAALEPVVTTWLDAKAAASEYAQQLAAVVWAQGKSIAAMRQEHAQLVAQMQRLADQQKQLKESDSDAARGVDELRLRLVELDGTEEDIARARHARDVAQVQRKMALMAIDLQRAQIAKQDDEATRLNQELALLREQLKLLDQVAAAEARQRRTGGRAGGANTASSGGASGGLSAPSPAGGGAPVTPSPSGGGQGWGSAPVNITLNANGVNDPVQLARLIEPEMKRLARLAR